MMTSNHGNIYITYFTLAPVITCIFMFTFSLIFLRIKNRMRATTHLMLAYFFMGIFFAGYIAGSLLYDPMAAHHRWITAGTILIVLTNLILFFVVYPENDMSGMYRVAIFVLSGATVIALLLFVVGTVGTQPVYHYTSHYWDFDNDSSSSFLGAVIGFYIVLMLVIGIWKFYIEQSSLRWHILTIALIGFVTFIFPALTNVLSRIGIVERDIYFIILNVSTTVGFFTFGIYYLQYATPEKTSLITRVLGISFASILLMFHLVCLITMNINENDYDRLSQKNINRIIEDKPKTSELIYNYSPSLKDNISDRKLESLLYGDCFISEIFHTKNISQYNFQNSVFQGYARVIYILKVKGYEQKKIKNTILDLSSEIKKIRESLTENSDESIYTRLMKMNNKSVYFQVYLKAVADGLKKTSDFYSGMAYFPVIFFPGKRFYRDDSQGNMYCSYVYINTKTGRFNEAGFSYLHYRDYIHKRSYSILILLIGITVIIFLAYPLTLIQLIIKPLRDMRIGIKNMSKGSTDYQIPVKMHDEIGILVENFNDMARTIFNAKNQLSNNADELKSEVLRRTAELEETLSRQNGDYFLTSNLIEPLNKNKAHGVNVSIDFIIKQKMNFTFRKWHKDIGGDVCMASNLFLKGKLYSVFVNADAMGKSIQGAGGALVLGAGMQTIIERGRFSSIEQDQYPEVWLKNALVELQRMFESFEGAMMMSLVMGLVDDECGFVYYINAEHPWTILYRKGKAAFIEQELLIRKLGFEAAGENPVTVKIFQMQPHDILVAGSDGRDDLLFGMDGDARIINEDETLILKITERADGNLNEMLKQIEKKGELTDDLSLLSIIYNPVHVNISNNEKKYDSRLDEIAALEKKQNYEELKQLLINSHREDRNNSKILKKLIKVLIDLKDFKGAVPYLDEYIEIAPYDTESIFIYSRCLTRTGKIKKAAEIAWRTILREPHNVRYKLHLAKLLIHIKDYIAADQLLDEVLRIDSDNKKALELKNSL